MPIDREGDGPPLRKAETKAEDGSGLRATPFTDDVFDDEYYRGRGRATGGSPLGLIVGVVCGAALAGGAAWFVLKDQAVNVAGTTQDGVRMVKADPSPYKIKPDNPGGMQIENQDKTVYDRVAKADAPNRVENLLPPPEQPKTPPKVEPKPKPAEPPVTVKSPLDEKRDELAAMIASLEKKDANADKTVIEDGPAMPQSAAVPAAVPASEAKPLVPNPPSPPPSEQVAAAAPGPGLQVQLAAAKSEEGAMAEWNRIKTKHPELVGALTPSVIRADLGERGVFYRLRAGTLPDKPAADALCAALTADGNACLVVKP